MKRTILISATIIYLLVSPIAFAYQKYNSLKQCNTYQKTQFTNAADLGFSPKESGRNNTRALQLALDNGGTIIVSQPGIYKIAGTCYIGDNTSLVFGNGVVIEKSAENGVFTHVFLNKGALTRTYNYHISITGLNLMVNGVDQWMDPVYGLRGQVAFFYVKDLNIDHLRCTDVAKGQYCLQVCTFEDLLIHDVVIKGNKDGIHLGAGKRFKITDAVFETGDDAIALAPGDWVSGNPEFGDLEDGVIENCTDLKAGFLQGAFAKIVASGWTDWKSGMEIRHGNSVVSNGKIYRALTNIDSKIYKSTTQPTFEKGTAILDGIKWLVYQTDTIHTAVVKNVTFRDIFLESVRVPFQITCYDVDYDHSYYRGAPIPVQGPIMLDNIIVLNPFKRALVSVSSPCNLITIKNSIFENNNIEFQQSSDFDSYPNTYVNISNCTFKNDGNIILLSNQSKRNVFLKTSGSMEMGQYFHANVDKGLGSVTIESDLTGLRK